MPLLCPRTHVHYPNTVTNHPTPSPSPSFSPLTPLPTPHFTHFTVCPLVHHQQHNATPRHYSLRNIMSSESIQTLCILLRKNNAAFLDPINTGGGGAMSTPSQKNPSSGKDATNANSSSSTRNVTSPESSQRTVDNDSASYSSRSGALPSALTAHAPTAGAGVTSGLSMTQPMGCQPMGLQGSQA